MREHVQGLPPVSAHPPAKHREPAHLPSPGSLTGKMMMTEMDPLPSDPTSANLNTTPATNGQNPANQHNQCPPPTVQLPDPPAASSRSIHPSPRNHPSLPNTTSSPISSNPVWRPVQPHSPVIGTAQRTPEAQTEIRAHSPTPTTSQSPAAINPTQPQPPRTRPLLRPAYPHTNYFLKTGILSNQYPKRHPGLLYLKLREADAGKEGLSKLLTHCKPLASPQPIGHIWQRLMHYQS